MTKLVDRMGSGSGFYKYQFLVAMGLSAFLTVILLWISFECWDSTFK